MTRGLFRRISALAIDVVLALLLCYALHWYVGFYFSGRAFVTLRVGQPGTLWRGAIPWFLSLIGPYFYTLPLSFFLIFLPEALWGRSIGKLFTGLKISGRKKDLWLRYLLKTTLFWGTTLALMLGSWQLLVFFLVVGILILLLGLPGRLTATSFI
jgi:hypothetical protein